jgi:eukaryotic-like serine/threonine-protein kinase
MGKRLLLAGVLAVAAALLGFGAFFLVLPAFERPPEVTVPQVVGLGLAEALDHLSATRLDLEVTGLEHSDDVPENLVLRQRPEAGRVVKAKRSVRVTLSRGPERHTVPQLAGLLLEDARILLEEAGMRAEVTARIAAGREGEVVAQGIEPGTWLRAGGAVPLAVSSGSPPPIYRMPELEGLPVERALAKLETATLRVGEISRVPTENPDEQETVLAQAPLPGYPVPRGAEVALTVGEVPPPPDAPVAPQAAAPLRNQPLPPAAAGPEDEVRPPKPTSPRTRTEGGTQP